MLCITVIQFKGWRPSSTANIKCFIFIGVVLSDFLSSMLHNKKAIWCLHV